MGVPRLERLFVFLGGLGGLGVLGGSIIVVALLGGSVLDFIGVYRRPSAAKIEG